MEGLEDHEGLAGHLGAVVGETEGEERLVALDLPVFERGQDAADDDAALLLVAGFERGLAAGDRLAAKQLVMGLLGLVRGLLLLLRLLFLGIAQEEEPVSAGGSGDAGTVSSGYSRYVTFAGGSSGQKSSAGGRMPSPSVSAVGATSRLGTCRSFTWMLPSKPCCMSFCRSVISQSSR